MAKSCVVISQSPFEDLTAFRVRHVLLLVSILTSKGAVTCAVCPASAWLVTFLIGSVSTGVVTWSALRCGASGESGKKVAAAPLSKTAAAAAAAKTWFAKHPLDYMLHNRFPWKRSGRRSSMWPPYSLRRNLSAAACRPCDRSLTRRDSDMESSGTRLTIFHHNSNVMEISFCSRPKPNEVIATRFCTWRDSCAVVACAKFCCDMIISNWITAKCICHRIWIVMEISLPGSRLTKT